MGIKFSNEAIYTGDVQKTNLNYTIKNLKKVRRMAILSEFEKNEFFLKNIKTNFLNCEKNNPICKYSYNGIKNYLIDWCVDRDINFSYLIDNILDKPRKSLMIKTIYKYFDCDEKLYYEYLDHIRTFIPKKQFNPIYDSTCLFDKPTGEEIVNFISINNILSFPIEWLENFEFVKCLDKGSIQQGKNIGPDFIFKNSNGIEFSFPIKNLFLNPNWRDNEKVIWSILKNTKYNEFVKDFDSFINQIFLIINDKINKSKKYIKLENLYLNISVVEYSSLGPGLTNIKWYWKPLAQLIVNNNSVFKSKFKKIIIT